MSGGLDFRSVSMNTPPNSNIDRYQTKYSTFCLFDRRPLKASK